MKKPNENLLELYKLGTIHGIYKEQVQTGTDTSATWCIFTGDNNKVLSGWWSEYGYYLKLEKGHWDCIASIEDNYLKEILTWIEFEKKNKRELATYKRLKAKFEDNI